jgi:hypothetical protein
MLFTLVIVSLSIASAAMLPSLEFDGDVASLLQSDRKAFADYRELIDNFPKVASAITLHVTAQEGRLVSKAGLERLAEFQLELALLTPVEQVFSPLSLQKYDPRLKQLVPLIPAEFVDDATARKAVESALSGNAALGAMLSTDADSVMMLVVLAENTPRSMSRLSGLLLDIDQLASDAGFAVLKSGRAVIQAELISHLIRDQIVVTLLGIAVGIVIAFVVFRDWRAVLLCSGTASVALLWTLGAMAALGQPLDAMTTILPILGSILAFADSLHLLSHWRRRIIDGEERQDALIRAIREIGPATALTSITTALAFSSMIIAGPALADLAVFGVVTVTIAFLSSIVVLPVGCSLIATFFGMPGAAGGSIGSWLEPLTVRTALKVPRIIAAGTGILIAALLIIHIEYEPSFSPAENLPASSQAHRAEAALSADFGGSDRIFAVVPLAQEANIDDPASKKALLSAHDAMAEQLGAERVLSMADIWRDIDTDDPEVRAQLAEAGLAGNGRAVLVIGMISGVEPAATLKALHGQLISKPALSEATITGFAIMSAFEATHIIERLKSGLLLAVALAAGIVGLVCRSARVFLAVAMANLLVVLFIEACAWAFGRPGEFALYVALTIALGIGIDDSVHILNLMRRTQDKISRDQIIRRAIGRAAPALAASTIVLCANILVTAVSVLPVVTFIGLTISLTLAFALFSNVIILPSILAAGMKKEA